MASGAVVVDAGKVDDRDQGVVVNNSQIWDPLLNQRLTFPPQQHLCPYPLVQPIVLSPLDLNLEVPYLLRV